MICLKTEKLIKWGKLSFACLSIALLFYVGLKYAAALALPFIAAYGAAYGVRRFSEAASKKIKLPQKLWSALTVIALAGTIFALAWFGISALLREITEAVPKFAEVLGGTAAENISRFVYEIGERIGMGAEFAERVYSALGNIAANLAGGMAENGGASALPSVVFATVLSAVSFFSFVFGNFRISKLIVSLFPEEKRDEVLSYMNGAVLGAVKYIRANVIVTLVNAILLAVGFMLIKNDHAVLLAVAVAILDVLPVFGVGTVLIPWAIYCFLCADYFKGAALLVITAAVSIVRQSLEAKLVGKGAGVHPVFILAAVYAGYKICGFGGMILLPLGINITAYARNTADKKRLRG